MSQKIIFKGTPDGCFLPLEPNLLQLNLQEPNSTKPNDIEHLKKLSVKKAKVFLIRSLKVTGLNCVYRMQHFFIIQKVSYWMMKHARRFF